MLEVVGKGDVEHYPLGGRPRIDLLSRTGRPGGGQRSRLSVGAQSTSPDLTALLLAVLEEVIYLLDTAGELPAEVTVRPAGAGWLLLLRVVDVGVVESLGAVPKAVSRHELSLRKKAQGWVCSALLDV